MINLGQIPLTISQIQKMRHALGLSKKKKDWGYRNYYNSGDTRLPELDDLCDKGLMVCELTAPWKGGFYYFVTEDGVRLMNNVFGKFKVKE